MTTETVEQMMTRLDHEIVLADTDTVEFHHSYLRYTRLNNEYLIEYADRLNNKTCEYIDANISKVTETIELQDKTIYECRQKILELQTDNGQKFDALIETTEQAQNNFEKIDEYVKSSSEEIVALCTTVELVQEEQKEQKERLNILSTGQETTEADIACLEEEIAGLKKQMDDLKIAVQAQAETPKSKVITQFVARDFHISDFAMGFLIAIIGALYFNV